MWDNKVLFFQCQSNLWPNSHESPSLFAYDLLKTLGYAWWPRPAIPATWRLRKKRLQVQGQIGQLIEILSQSKNINK